MKVKKRRKRCFAICWFGKNVGYEPADLTVHSPPRTAEGGFIFLYMCLVFQKNVLIGKLVLLGVIHVKGPKKFFSSAYSLKPNFNKFNIFRT